MIRTGTYLLYGYHVLFNTYFVCFQAYMARAGESSPKDNSKQSQANSRLAMNPIHIFQSCGATNFSAFSGFWWISVSKIEIRLKIDGNEHSQGTFATFFICIRLSI